MYHVYHHSRDPCEYQALRQENYKINKQEFEMSHSNVLAKGVPVEYIYGVEIQKRFDSNTGDLRWGWLFTLGADDDLERRLRREENQAHCYTGGSYAFRCVDIRDKSATYRLLGESVTQEQLDDELTRIKSHEHQCHPRSIGPCYDLGYNLPPMHLRAEKVV